MHQSLNDFILPVVVTLLGVIAVSLYLHLKTVRAQVRSANLQMAKKSMMDHYAAMQKVIDDPALPVAALEFLCAFSHVIADKEAAEELIKELTTIEEQPQGRSPVSESMDKVAEFRPDLYENFIKALLSGLAVMTLRWPGHSGDFVKIFTPLIGDHRNEARAVRVITSMPRNGGGSFIERNHAPA